MFDKYCARRQELSLSDSGSFIFFFFLFIVGGFICLSTSAILVSIYSITTSGSFSLFLFLLSSLLSIWLIQAVVGDLYSILCRVGGWSFLFVQ